MKRKKPRVGVTWDRVGTRQSRWLQLPFGISVLLMLLSAFLHCLASQGVFIVESYSNDFDSMSLALLLLPVLLIVMRSIWTAMLLPLTVLCLLPVYTNTDHGRFGEGGIFCLPISDGPTI